MVFPTFSPPSMPSMSSMPHPRELREKWQPGTSNYLLFAWALSSLLAAIIPVVKWTSERNSYFSYYGEYKLYEMQQKQYEQQANGNWNGSYYNSCGWWDFKCKYQAKVYLATYGNNNGGNQQGGGGNENNQMRAVLPGWYYLFGGSIEMDQRQREEMGLTGPEEGGMKFVFACTIIMFIALAAYGFRTMYTGKDRSGLIFSLIMFGMFTIMNLLTTVQGTIETDDRFFEDSVYGWFGQWAVLVAYTDFWLIIHCFSFALLLGVLKLLDMKAKKDVEDAEKADDMVLVSRDESIVTENYQLA
jgi:hypothetical protein